MRPTTFRGVFREDAEARAVYAEAAGIQQIWPLAVAIPADADDVVALVTWAGAAGVSLVPRGSGSSMAGGAIGPGVIVDLGRLRQIEPVDRLHQRIRVGPAVTRDEADGAAAACGLRFPVDPSSGAFCTVGGMASTNAAGAHTLKYGPMRPWVVALDCVFADGTRATIRRGAPPPTDIPVIARFLADVAPTIRTTSLDSLRHVGVRKDSSGYALAAFAERGEIIDLLVGSEGTLAVFVGLELALCPRPAATAGILAAFPSLEAAVRGATVARNAGASACELMDRTFLDFVRQDKVVVGNVGDLPSDAEAVLLIEVEGESPANVAAAVHALTDTLSAAGSHHLATAIDGMSESRLWHLRHAASPVLARLDPALKSMQFIEDGAVPPPELAAYVRGVRGALDRHGLRGVIFGHAGDAHIHVNPLIDVRLPDWRQCVNALLADVTALTAALHGTLTGEHGDGRLRTPLMTTMWSASAAAALPLFAAVKAAFDPVGLLNPGVKVPTPGEPILGAIKYDPALPDLPTAARQALDRITHERAYHTPRLELLAAATPTA